MSLPEKDRLYQLELRRLELEEDIKCRKDLLKDLKDELVGIIVQDINKCVRDIESKS